MAALGEVNLTDVCWWERRLSTSISAVAMYGDSVLVGDWDGLVECWTFEGELKWRTKTIDRIGQFAFSAEQSGAIDDGKGGEEEQDEDDVGFLYATAGRHLVRMNPEDGEIFWSIGLDGSADSIEVAKDGSVWTTSAVYDIELNDFIESACTLVDTSGEILGQAIFAERPWHIEVRDDTVLLGLGRPRGGFFILRPDENYQVKTSDSAKEDGNVAGERVEKKSEKEELDRLTLEHYEVRDSPITCGIAGRKKTVLGHADGSLTAIGYGKKFKISQPFKMRDDGIDGLICTASGIATVDEAGFISHLTTGQEDLWSSKLTNAEAPISEGPCLDNSSSRAIWVTAWNGIESTLASYGHDDGEQQTQFVESSRIRVLDYATNYLAVGFDDGRILLLERELLIKRLAAGPSKNIDENVGIENSKDALMVNRDSDDLLAGLKPAEIDENERRQAMRDRLKSLRGEHK
jgi:hypothetical protein